MGSMINIILLTILGVFVLSGMLFGFIRGLWKTTFRTVWLIISLIIIALVTPSITYFLLNIDINTTVNIDLGGYTISKITTVKDTIDMLLTSFIGVDTMIKYPFLGELILVIPSALINIVVFILLFFATKYLLLPLSAIIYHLCVGGGKKKGDATKKKSKHRLFGALVGVTTGVVVSFAILMPVVSISDTLNKAKAGEILEQSMGTPIVREYLDAYNDSFVANMYNMTGLTALSNLTFSQVASMKVDKDTYRLIDDMSQVISIYGKTTILLDNINNYMGAEYDYTKLTKEQANTIITQAKDILNTAKNVKSINAFNDYLIPLVIDYIKAHNIQLNPDIEIHDAMISTLNSMSTAITTNSQINIYGELSALLDIALHLNNNNLLIPLLTFNTDTLATNITTIDDNFASDLSNKIFALQTVNVTAPNLVNLGMLCLNKSFDITYVNTHTVTSETIKNTLGNLIDNAIDIYASLDFESGTFITDNSYAPMGKLLDTLQNSNIIASESYYSLIEFGLDQVKNIAADTIPADYKNTFDSVFNVLPDIICNVTSWETELTTINTAIKMMTGENGILAEGFDAKNEAHLTHLGKTCDQLAKTQLLSSRVNLAYVEGGVNKMAQVPFLTYVLYNGITDLKPILQDNLAETNYSSLTDILDEVKLNLINSNYNPTNDTTFWEEEFTKLHPTADLILSTLEGGEIEMSSETGKVLDTLKTTKLFGINTTANLVAKIIDIFKEDIDFGDEDISTAIQEVLNDVTLRLNSTELRTLHMPTEKYWEIEMTHMSTLMDIDLSGVSALDNIGTTGATIDDIVFGNLPTIRQSSLLYSQDFRKIIATTISTLTDNILVNLTPGTTEYTAITNAINSIKTNYEDTLNITITSFEKELTHLKNMKDIDPDVFGSDNSDNAKVLGAKLDNIAYNDIESDNSATITKSIIDKIIVDCMSMIEVGNTAPTYIQTAVNDIKTNVNKVYTNEIDILGWEVELVHLYNVSKLESVMITDIESLTTTTATNIGNILDGLVYNYDTDDNKDTTLNSKIVTNEGTNPVIPTLMTSLVTSIKYDEATASNTEKMVNKILTNIADTDTIVYSDTYYDTDTTKIAYLYTEIFTDVVYIKDQMSSIETTIDNPSLSSLTLETASKIDQALENIQEKRVAGVITTREIALDVLNEVTSDSYRQTSTYAKNAYDYYQTRVTNSTTDKEDYFDLSDTDVNTYTNTFAKIISEFQSSLA